MGVQHFSHFGMTVADPERSIRFYRDVLGFTPVAELQVDDARAARLVGLDDLQLHATFLERDGTRIELMHYVVPGHEPESVPRPMNRLGLTHMAIRVSDLAGMLAQLEAAGVDILRDSQVSNPDWQSEVVFILDPDGVRIELIQMPGDPSAAPGQAFEA